MSRGFYSRFVTVFGFLTLSLNMFHCQAAERILLNHAQIVSNSHETSFVKYGVEDLAGYLKEVTENEIPMVGAADDTKTIQILIGAGAVAQVFPQIISDAKLGEETYLLKVMVKGNATYVIATGATPRGTKAALSTLMKAIQTERQSAFVPAKLDLLGRPAFAKRGMHFNGWAFKSPYSFRAWREEDWRRYLDILSYQGVNVLYLWPFIEIMPIPLSAEDQAYLKECRRVVDYAQQKHGMEVWIMQCTNRVAKDRCGVIDPRCRPYWRPSQEDLNPGNPQHYQAIMASREAMYKIVNNADGVCNIDSDPGFYPGSPLSDYIKVLQGCRALLDRHNIHGKQAKLINWMLWGWGRKNHFDPQNLAEHQLLTLRNLKQALPEPLWLLCHQAEWLPMCRNEGLIERTLYFPYGAIETEPCYPMTNVQIDAIRNVFNGEMNKTPELGGVMGNVQTPILQFPNVYFYTSAMFDIDYRRRTEKDVLLDLAGYLYPEHKQLLADCYLAMKESDPSKIDSLVERLDGIVRENKLGVAGAFGRKLFPDRSIVAQSLVLQLRLRTTLEKLVANVTLRTPKADCEKLVSDYFNASLAWDTAHGWYELWGFRWSPQFDPRLSSLCSRMNANLGGKPRIEAMFDKLTRSLCAKYKEEVVLASCITPWKNAVLAAPPCIVTLAQKAKATASITPDPIRYSPGAANDGSLPSLYWPGGLIHDNAEWLQLTWDQPQSFSKVVVRFLQHTSMHGRTIHLQKETASARWEDFATTVIPKEDKTPHAVATFTLPSQVTLDKIRVVNLLDLFEIEIQ